MVTIQNNIMVTVQNTLGDAVIVPSRKWDSKTRRLLKRVLDIVIAVCALILLAPLLLAISIGIILDSRGPVLYRWRVAGKGGRPFTSWKFRSMVVDADAKKSQLLHCNEMTEPMFKMKRDPRVTRFGRYLRRYSLDELPQLVSVLIGDISLVGPRPPQQSDYVHFTDVQKQRMLVKPGITCLWQVSGRNSISNFDDWVRLDFEYIQSWSLWLDFRILLKTISAVLRGTGC